MEQCYNIILTLHEQEIFHRDIRPGQFLLFEKNIVKLRDFGSYYTRLPIKNTTVSQNRRFNPDYVAPEYRSMGVVL
jgi:serine/threonine protein kinase